MHGSRLDDFESSLLQELAGLVQRAERNACFREGFGRAFLAVDHGQHQRDLAAGLADRFDRLHCRAAGRGDVLDDHDALALQALVFGQAFDREPAPCSFGFLRTKNAAIGWPLIHDSCAIAPASGTAPISSPPT